MSCWSCQVCGYEYDEEHGINSDELISSGRWVDIIQETVQPGTPWSELSKDWYCPQCGAEKALFVKEHKHEHKAA